MIRNLECHDANCQLCRALMGATLEPCPETLRSEAPEFEPESSPADSAPSVPLWLPEGGA